MKKIWVLTCFVFLVIPNGQAQLPDFAESYKKAYNFRSISSDSVFFWAQKSLAYAQTSYQKYQTYYLIGHTAYLDYRYNLALRNYQKAFQYAPNSTTKFNTISAMAAIHFQLGNYSQAKQKNWRCRDFFKKTKQWVSLSYAYDLWGRILLKQNDVSCLAILRRALQLKQQHAPEQVGASYINLTEAFADLYQYDSAVAYQRKVIKHLFDQPEDNRKIHKIYLAKYLIFANKLSEAQKHLDEIQLTSKNQDRELTLCHVRNLLLLAKGEKNTSYSKYCDSLFQFIVHHPVDSTNKMIAKERAIVMYKDALKVKNSRKTIYKQDQQTRFMFFICVGLGIGLVVILLLFFKYYKKYSTSLPTSIPPTHTELDLLIERIELVCNKTLNEDEINIIRLRKAGVTYREIAAELQLKESTVRNKMHRLAKRGQRTSIERFF